MRKDQSIVYVTCRKSFSSKITSELAEFGFVSYQDHHGTFELKDSKEMV